MSKERKDKPELLAAMVGITLGNPDSVLLGWAMAIENDLPEVAEMMRTAGEEVGLTDEEFEGALQAWRVTNKLLGG